MMDHGPDQHAEAARQNKTALNWLNFFLADVKDGVGPFLAIFLMTAQHWDAASIGIALTTGGLATVLARTPAGAIVDSTQAKRGLIAVSAVAVAVACITMALRPEFWPVAIAQCINGIADAIFPLAVTAISLGIVGRRAFSGRVGLNEAWNHGGNVVTAILAGVAGYMLGPSAVLWIAAALAVLSIAAVYSVDGRAINHEVARGEDENDGEMSTDAFKYLLQNRPLLWFTMAITLFHFANAAMLPLAGQKLSQGQPQASPLFMSACIIAAQIVMVPIAILVGRKADDWGRKPLFLAGFGVLPIRGALFALADDPYSIIAIQLLDGVGAGIFGALFYIVVSDLTRGSGRFNLAEGAAAASWGLGAALSNGVAGLIVNQFGYSAAFTFLAVCAAGAFAIYWFAVPESRDFEREAREREISRARLRQRAGA